MNGGTSFIKSSLLKANHELKSLLLLICKVHYYYYYWHPSTWVIFTVGASFSLNCVSKPCMIVISLYMWPTDRRSTHISGRPMSFILSAHLIWVRQIFPALWNLTVSVLVFDHISLFQWVSHFFVINWQFVVCSYYYSNPGKGAVLNFRDCCLLLSFWSTCVFRKCKKSRSCQI